MFYDNIRGFFGKFMSRRPTCNRLRPVQLSDSPPRGKKIVWSMYLASGLLGTGEALVSVQFFLGSLWDLTNYKCLRDTELKRGLGDVLLLQGAGLQQIETEGARDYGLQAKTKKIDKIFQLGIFIHKSEKTQPQKIFKRPLRISRWTEW